MSALAVERLPVIRPLLSVVATAPPRVQRALYEHRVCAPEHASLVRAACMQDPSVLPRWHQDDRGPRNEHRGIHVVAPEGAYSAIPVWQSRERWVSLVPIVAGLQPDVVRRWSVSVFQLRQWAKVKSGYAAERTGRRCIVEPKVLASVLGVSKRHAQRLNACARELGLEKVVMWGRRLTYVEKFHCWKNGSRQGGLSTETALTIPPSMRGIVDSVTPAKGSSRIHKSHDKSGVLHGLAADRKGSAPPTLLKERRDRRRAARRLAAEVARSVPWLAPEGPARLAPALMRFATAPEPWTARDVVDAIETHRLRTGRGAIEVDRIRTRPAALLASILRELDVDADHPSLNPFPTIAPPTPDSPVSLVDVEPCGSPSCDHGWIELPDGRHARCASCPPPVLRSVVAQLDQGCPGYLEEPPF